VIFEVLFVNVRLANPVCRTFSLMDDLHATSAHACTFN